MCAKDTEIVLKSCILCIHAKANGNHLIRASKCCCTNNNSNHNHNTSTLFRNTASELGWHVNKQGKRCSPGSWLPHGFNEGSIHIHNPMHYLHWSARSLTPNKLSFSSWWGRWERGGALPKLTLTAMGVFDLRGLTFHSAQSNFHSILSYHLSPSRKPIRSQERCHWSLPGPDRLQSECTYLLWSVACLCLPCHVRAAHKHPSLYFTLIVVFLTPPCIRPSGPVNSSTPR